MKIDPNAPAYPNVATRLDGTILRANGMTIRTQIAAMAMAAIISHQQHQSCEMTDRETLADCAIECADALIAELNKTSDGGAA